MNMPDAIATREGLIAWIADALHCSPADIREEDSLVELGLSSLMMMRLPAMLKKAGVSVRPADLLADATVGGWIRLLERGRGPETGGAQPSVSVTLPFALTDMQRAYWMGRQSVFPLGGIASHGYLEIEAADAAYDAARLEDCLNMTIAAHPMLRMTLTADGRQTILKTVPRYSIAYSEAPGARAGRRAEMQAEMLPADVWPLFRVCMTGNAAAPRSVLHISFDTLLFDIASLALWLRQWHALYTGAAKDIPAPEAHFARFVAATEARKRGNAAEEHRTWWRGRAETLPRAPRLPLARHPREVTPPVILRKESFLDAGAWGALRGRAAAAGATAAGLLTALLAVALSRFSRDHSMTINLTLFDRAGERAAYDAVLGDFTSMLPVAVHTGDGRSFAEICRAAREEILQALSRADVSGAEVNGEIARAQGMPNENPLPVVLTCATDSGADGSYLDAASLFGTLAFARNQAPQTWIDVQVTDYRGGVALIWDYVDGLFPDGLIDVMFDLFLQLGRKLTRAEAWSLPARSLCREDAWAASCRLLPGADKNLVTPFLEQAARQPDAPALITPEAVLSYGDMERLSRRLACRLVASGAVPRGSLVGVALPRGPLQVLAVLAVLRAGAAYLPVSVSDPPERLAGILAEGRTAAVVCDRERAALLPEGTAAVVLDKEAPEDGETPAELPPAADAADVAYVIFTSGSTGKPKGVAVSHRAALNTLLDINRRNGITSRDRIFGASQLNFDLSVYDIFGTFAAGAALVLPPHRSVPDACEWARQVEAEAVTVWNSVPALAQLLLESARSARCSLDSLRLFMLSGDWLPVELARSILALPRLPRLISMGGATEAAVWSVEKVVEDVPPDWKTVPYGKPLSGQMLYVLDAEMRLCPPWVPGEIYIAGVGLAEGYLHRPELTARAFVRHPATGERMYRTGDLGRLLPDGDIEFLGREDTQVKLNGMRIELGEIEAAVSGRPDVAQAVAVVAEHEGAKQLVVFVVPRRNARVRMPELRTVLGKTLPAAWLPSVLCLKEALPLSPNGKVDRKALTVEAGGALRAFRAENAPVLKTEGQEKIAEVWATVLNGARPGLTVSFFDAGGTSLLAMRLAAQLEAALERPVPVVSVFQYTTIAAQAEHFFESESLRPAEDERGKTRARKLGALAAHARRRGEYER